MNYLTLLLIINLTTIIFIIISLIFPNLRKLNFFNYINNSCGKIFSLGLLSYGFKLITFNNELYSNIFTASLLILLTLYAILLYNEKHKKI